MTERPPQTPPEPAKRDPFRKAYTPPPLGGEDEPYMRAEEPPPLYRERPPHEAPPPRGAPPPHQAPPPPRGRYDLRPLFAILEALRGGLPREVQEQFTGLIREVLLTLRSLIDWYLERLDRGPSKAKVEDIPID